jgi:hypothetical protein
MAKKTTKQEKASVRQELLKKMLDLSTAGFGLVAALAWNELIKQLVSQYIQPLVGGASGIISLLLYAVLVTILAVVVTINLSRLIKKD